MRTALLPPARSKKHSSLLQAVLAGFEDHLHFGSHGGGVQIAFELCSREKHLINLIHPHGADLVTPAEMVEEIKHPARSPDSSSQTVEVSRSHGKESETHDVNTDGTPPVCLLDYHR